MQGASARRASPGSYEGGEFTVGTDVPLVQWAAGCGGQAHRKWEQIGLVVAADSGRSASSPSRANIAAAYRVSISLIRSGAMPFSAHSPSAQ